MLFFCSVYPKLDDCRWEINHQKNRLSLNPFLSVTVLEQISLEIVNSVTSSRRPRTYEIRIGSHLIKHTYFPSIFLFDKSWRTRLHKSQKHIKDSSCQCSQLFCSVIKMTYSKESSQLCSFHRQVQRNALSSIRDGHLCNEGESERKVSLLHRAWPEKMRTRRSMVSVSPHDDHGVSQEEGNVDWTRGREREWMIFSCDNRWGISHFDKYLCRRASSPPWERRRRRRTSNFSLKSADTIHRDLIGRLLVTDHLTYLISLSHLLCSLFFLLSTSSVFEVSEAIIIVNAQATRSFGLRTSRRSLLCRIFIRPSEAKLVSSES